MPVKAQYRKDPTKFRKLSQEWRAEHRSQHRQYTRAYYRKHLKKCRKAQRLYYRKHKAEAQQYQQRWYKKHHKEVLRRASEWAKQNRERRLKIRRNWERTPHGVRNKQKNTAIRRARLRQNGGTLTTKQWEAKLRRYQHRCARCRRRRKLELHHIKPLADGGKNVVRNVLPLCNPCHVKTHRELKAARKTAAMRAPA